MAEQTIIGIDLGTTFSAVAYVDEDGVPRVIPNGDGETTTPSVVLIEDDGRMVVGTVAMNQWATRPDHVVRWVKRAMGTGDYTFQGKTAIQISAEILKQLKADAEAHLGRAVDAAVITCPAYFSSEEIKATRAAGELAGLVVKEIVKEPTAAAVHYGTESMRDGETVMVCDLGGGTYDATVLRYEAGVFIPLATRGEIQLGGHDWTGALTELVIERAAGELGGDPRDDVVAGQLLYEACEKAKRDLARRTDVSVTCTYQGRTASVRVTRADFDAKTRWLMERLTLLTEQALAKASLTWQQIDKVLMVGGSSRLLSMGAALEALTGKKPLQGREPDLMVALGAAILAKGKVRPRVAGGLREVAGGLREVIYKRTIARALGTRTVVFDGGSPRITNALVLPAGTETPVSRTRNDLTVASDGQRYFDTPVVEFEDDDEFVVVASFRFRCPPGAKRNDPIALTFNYDVSGIVDAEARDRSGALLPCERLPYEEPNLDEVVRARVQPLWVVFVLDASTSMDGVKMETAKRAVVDNARVLLETGAGACRVAVVTFASHAEVCCEVTDDLGHLDRCVEAIEADGLTAMDDGIFEAARLLAGAPAGAVRQVVMVTDGMPDERRQQATIDVASRVQADGIDLVSIALGDTGVDAGYLARLTTRTFSVTKIEKLGDAMFTLLAARQGGTPAAAAGLHEVSGGRTR